MRKLSGVALTEYQALNRLLIDGSHVRGRALSPGALVRSIRVRLKMSQRVLAARSGVPQPHLSQIERGARDPQIGTLSRLLEAMFCELILVPRERVKLGDALYAQAGRPAEYEHHRKRRMSRPTSTVWNE